MQVHIAIYDLSHGMARQLSAQFLGPDHVLEAIPHSGLLCFGQEYFFGAGIQSESPAQFRHHTGLQPMQTIAIGSTHVSQAAFEQWCVAQMHNGRFSATAYDLLECNCNHFAHTAALEGLGLSQGVPEWVLQVPQRFLASPMGQVVRPMLEQMQLRAPVDGAQSVSASTPSPAVNPWANNSTNTSVNTSSTSKKAETTNQTPPPHPLLDTFTKSLLSKDLKTVPVCISKIAADANSDDTAFLQHCQTKLTASEPLSLEEHTRLGQILWACLHQNRKVAMFALMLLRLLVVPANDALEPYRPCLDWIRQHLLAKEPTLSPPVRTMAWLVVSNAIPALLLDDEEPWTQGAIGALSDPQPTVRQAAAAALYNATLGLPEELSDTHVALLCAALEALGSELDATVRVRRLATAGRILVPTKTTNAAAVELALNLGLQENLQEILQQETTDNKDAETGRTLAIELDHLLSFHAALLG